MPSGHEPNTLELAELTLRLLPDLDFTLQEYGGEKYCVVEDRANSRFYQIGLAEYTFISLLDGHTSLSEALRLTSSCLGPNAFTEQHALSIVKWLVDCQLVTSPQSTDTERLIAVATKAQERSRVSRLNPLLVKISVFNPEQLLDSLTPWFGWLVSRSAVLAWLVLCTVAIQQFLANGDELSLATTNVLDRSNWFWLTLTWLGLKFFHEMGHALACRKFGGHVRDCGVILILFAPIPYVDVTSSWRFSSKWQRIATSGAGMFVELGIAAVAMLVWSNSQNLVVQHHAYNVMLLGSITTLAFNANFLMRFDGYYMLADWFEIPNLHSLGQQYLSFFTRRYLLGVKLDAPRWRKSMAIKLYGITSLAWRIFVCACLVIAAKAIFFGFGLLLSFAAVLMWVGVPSYRAALYVFHGKDTEQPNRSRFALVCACASLLLIAAFSVVPWPGRVAAPAIVQYAKPAHVHTGTSGTVAAVHVQPGQRVVKGQLLATLESPELETQLGDIELAIEQSTVRSRQCHLRDSLGAYQAEASAVEALKQKATELRCRVAALQVRAPASGKVVARDLHSLPGRYLPVGTELLTIADESRKQMVLSIHQDDIAHFRSQVGHEVSVCLTPLTRVKCVLETVEPRASDEVTHAALTAAASGPIATRQDPNNDVGQTWRYLQPRFEGNVALANPVAERLHVGQKAHVKLSMYNDSLGGHLCEVVENWFRHRITI